jgi:ABC-type dipeptide/oligopeptide/nickel transport system permease subunit
MVADVKIEMKQQSKVIRQWHDIFYAFTRRPLAIFGSILFLIIVFVAITAPYIAPKDPLRQRLAHNLRPPVWAERGDPEYLLGTDNFGRDILSRLMYGARVSLTVAGLASLFSMIVGVSVGLIGGYFEGWVETILMRIVDIFLAFPLILIAISLASILGPNMNNLILVMALTGWMVYARVVRSEMVNLRNSEFIVAAKMVGVPVPRLLTVHFLPNIIAPALVLFTFGFAQFIILESALSFLGLGVPPPTPTWGRMLYDGRDFLTVAWWMITLPGLFIMITALSLNFIGDGLRDALDPRLRNIS